jgi:hypothetical protein
MKYTIVSLVILFPLLATAQTNANLDSLARQVLDELEYTWTLGIDSTSDAVDIRRYNEFKSLFDSSATVDDEFNAFYHYDFDQKTRRIKGTYQIDVNPKPFDIYAHDVALQVKKIRVDSVELISETSQDLNTKVFVIKRTVYAEKKRQYVLDPESYASALLASRKGIDLKPEKLTTDLIKAQLIALIKKSTDSIYQFRSEDTLSITMFYNQSYIGNETVQTFKINRIKRVNDSIECENDVDKDAILDHEEVDKKNPDQPGDFTANGLPDYDLDGVPDDSANVQIDRCKDTYGHRDNHGCPENYFITNNKLDGFVGFQMNAANINLPELNQLGYDVVDVLQSQKGALKNPGLTGGLTAGINYAYYFGHGTRKNGISVGLTYSGFTADYELTEPIVYTFKSMDEAGDPYRRQIKIDSLKESITYHIFNIPVMYNLRGYYGKYGKKKNNNDLRSWFNFQAGPSLMIFHTTSDYNAHISFGGLYQTDGQKIIYTDPFDNSDTYNFFLTADSINAQNPNPGADTIFNQLKANADHYDFANNKSYVGTQKNPMRLAVAINLGFDLQQQISEALAFKIGAHFVYAPLPGTNEKYKPIDKTTDPFQSIYNSNAKSSYSAFGLTAGIVCRF